MPPQFKEILFKTHEQIVHITFLHILAWWGIGGVYHLKHILGAYETHLNCTANLR